MESTVVLRYLENAAMRSLALWAAAALGLWVCRVKSASSRHAVWTVVTVGMLAVLALQFATPSVALRVVQRPVALAPATPTLPVGDGAIPSHDVAMPTPIWPGILVGLWATGVLLMVGRLAYGYAFTLRLVRASRQTEHDLWESDWIAVPVTIGSRVVLPASAREWTLEKRTAVLAHERAHVARHDWSIAAMASINRAVFWFHPLAWWLERRLSALAEEACDDLALAQTGAREAYARTLVEIAADVKSGSGRVVWEALAMARGTEVRGRVERILDEARELSRGVSRTRWVAMVAGAMPLVWLAAAVHWTRVEAVAAAPAPVVIEQSAEQPERVRQLQERVKSLEDRISQFKADNMSKLPDQFTTNNLPPLQLGLASQRLTQIRERLLQLETQFQNVSTQSAYYEHAANSPNLRDIQVLLFDRRAALAAAMEQFAPNHPTVKKLQAAVASLEAQLEGAERDRTLSAEMEQKRSELVARGNLLRKEEEGLRQDIAATEKRIEDLNAAAEENNRRQAGMADLERQYSALIHDYAAAKQQLDRATSQGPVLLSRANPDYTADARRAKVQGTVQLSVTVGEDGTVREATVIRGLGHGLDEKAIECVSKWRFRPATLDGRAVTAFVMVEVPFRLQP